MILIYLLASSIIVPTIVGTIFYNSFPNYGKLITWFFYTGLFAEIASVTLSYNRCNNLVVIYFYLGITAVMLSFIYTSYLRRPLILWYFLVPVIAVAEAYVNGSDTFPSFTGTAMNLLTIGICLQAYYEMIALRSSKDMFYFNSVLLLYASSSTTVFFTARYVQGNNLELMYKLFGLHAYLNCGINILFAASLWTLYRSSSTVR